MKTKIIAGILLGILLISSAFAYDLTDKEKAKGDTIASKIMMIINKKPEEKREKLTKSVITQLETLQERARKNEKMAALIGYVAEKMKSGTGGVVNSRYPGCDKDDIALDNGQIWSACDVGSSAAGQPGEKFAWGSMMGYKDTSTPNKAGPASDWNESDPQGPCASGYHIPSKAEVEKAIIATKSQTGGLVDSLNLTNSEYWTNTFHINDGPALGNINYSFGNNIATNYGRQYLNIRCVKD